MGKVDDLINVIDKSKADAVAIAHMLHYKKCSIEQIRKKLIKKNIQVR